MKLKEQAQVMESKLKFVSIFPTIQGEGINCGKNTTFIRLYTEDCFPNKRVCSFCDTINKKNYNENLDIQDIEEYLRKNRPNMVTITGGEPLSVEFKLLAELICICTKYCNYIELETNGAFIPLLTDHQVHGLSYYVDCINISPKLKTSNVNWEYDLSYKFLTLRNNSIFKFVVSEKNLEEELKEIEDWKQFNINNQIWLMPMTPCSKEFEQKLFDICVQKGYNYSTRLHITLFGNIEKEV